jgi:hypothetical protein
MPKAATEAANRNDSLVFANGVSASFTGKLTSSLASAFGRLKRSFSVRSSPEAAVPMP